jgi:hypothetical protein
MLEIRQIAQGGAKRLGLGFSFGRGLGVKIELPPTLRRASLEECNRIFGEIRRKMLQERSLTYVCSNEKCRLYLT